MTKHRSMHPKQPIVTPNTNFDLTDEYVDILEGVALSVITRKFILSVPEVGSDKKWTTLAQEEQISAKNQEKIWQHTLHQ